MGKGMNYKAGDDLSCPTWWTGRTSSHKLSSNYNQYIVELRSWA